MFNVQCSEFRVPGVERAGPKADASYLILNT